MTEYCGIVEDFVVATSTVLTEVVVLQSSSGQAKSSVAFGITQQLQVSAANATSTAEGEGYARLVSSGNATSVVLTSVTANALASSTARARSYTFAAFNELATSEAVATSSIASMDAPTLLLTSRAVASSSVVVNATATAPLLVSTAGARSAALVIHEEVLEGEAEAASSVVLQRVVYLLTTSSATASSAALSSMSPSMPLLISAAAASSAVFQQLESNLLLVSSAEAVGDVWYKDPSRKAWLMNTETSAMSWYDNFDFESIASVGGKTLAVGPDGLYELVGDTDNGERIDAEIISGFTDFGVGQTKRVDSIYFGYTSDGTVKATVETYGSGHSPSTYLMETRAADAPRNSRIIPGKGLWGRYWRMTIRNVDGADFEVHDATVDIAMSTRRV